MKVHPQVVPLRDLNTGEVFTCVDDRDPDVVKIHLGPYMVMTFGPGIELMQGTVLAADYGKATCWLYPLDTPVRRVTRE